MKIKIHNNNYEILLTNYDDPNLEIDESYKTGVCDMLNKKIYIANNLNKDAMYYTIFHEITHAVTDSYGFLQVEWDNEIIADFVANYNETINSIASEVIKYVNKKRNSNSKRNNDRTI